MKHLNVAVGLLVFILAVAENDVPGTTAQTAEPPTTPDTCHVDEGAIWNIAFSADGQYLSADWPLHSVRIWDVPTRALLATLTDPVIDPMELFAFSPDNKYLITGGNAGVVILWDIRSGEKIRTFSSPQKVRTILSLSISPDGRSIMATYPAIGHLLWNVTSGVEEMHLAEDGSVFSQFSPDGTLLLTQLELGPIQLWDRKSAQLLHTFDIDRLGTDAGPVSRGMFSPDGRFVLIPRPDGTTVADVKTYRTVRTLGVATSTWQFSPDGRYLLARKQPGTVFVWDLERGALVHEFPALSPLGYPVVVAFLNSQTIFLAKDSVGTPRPQTIFSVHDLASGDERREVSITMRYQDILRFAISPDGRYLALSSQDPSTLTLWDVEQGKQLSLNC